MNNKKINIGITRLVTLTYRQEKSRLFVNKLNIYVFFLVIFLLKISNICDAQTSNNNTELTKVNLQLKWKHQYQFAGYYAAIEQGYYKAHGVEVTLIEAVNDTEPGLAVFEGKADFGISTSDIVLMKNSGYKPVILATFFQHSAQILITSVQSGINNIHQLKGKKIALEPHAADIITYMSDEGISIDQCEVSYHHFSPIQLINGDVDAITAYITDEPYVLNKENFDFRIITPQMGGIDFYGDLLFCSDSLVKNNPELVENFIEASIEGWNYALNNENEIINLIFNKYSDRHSIEHLRYEAQQTRQLILPDVVELGYTNPGRWQQIVSIYKEANLIEDENILDGIFYDNYKSKPKDTPWNFIIFFLLIALILGGLLTFFYFLSRKLKNQIRISEQTKKALQQSKNRWSSLVSKLPGMVYRCRNDKEWTMTYLNEQCLNLTGYKAEEIFENKVISYNDLIHSDDQELVRKIVLYGITKNKNYEITYRIIDRFGKEKWVYEKGNGNFSSTGELLFLEGIILDVTDKKLAEAELKEHRENLEKIVEKRTGELENKNIELQNKNTQLKNYNKLFVDREFRIKELKDEIKKIKNR